MAFLRLQRAVPPRRLRLRAVHSSLSSVFHLDNAPELLPSGPFAIRRLGLSPSQGLPCRLTPGSAGGYGFGGLIPPESVAAYASAATHALLAFSPLGLSLSRP